MRLVTALAGLAGSCAAQASDDVAAASKILAQLSFWQPFLALTATLIAGAAVIRWLSRRRDSSYRIIVDQLGPRVAAGLLTPEGIIVEAGGLPWAPSVGRSSALVGRPLWEVEMFAADPRARHNLQEAIARAAGGELVCCDIDARSASGELQTIELCVRPLRKRGRIAGQLVVSAFDVTERKAAEVALASQLRIHENRFDGSPLAAVEWDTDLRVRRWSRRAEEIFGWKADEAIGHRSTELGLVPLYDGFESDRKVPVMGDAVLMPMRRCRRRDGSEFWLESYNSVLRGPQGEVVGVQTLCRDVTDKRRALAHALENESRFRNIFDQAAVGIALLDANGHWLTVNERACEITGYSEDELLALDFQTLTHPEDLAEDMRLAAMVMSGEIDSYRLEKRYIRKDGSIVWVLLHVRRIDATEETPAYFVSVIEDIAERKVAEERVASLTANLEAKVEARTAQLQQMMQFSQRRNDEMALVTEMIGMLPAVHDMAEAARVVARYMPQLFPQANGALYFEGAVAGRFMLQGQWGRASTFRQSFTVAECWALRRCHEHRVEDPHDPLRCQHLDDDQHERSYSCTPLIALGDVVGVLELTWGSCADGMAPDPVLLQTISEQVGLAISNARLRDELRRQAFYDPLTGLYNRRSLDDFIKRRHADWQRNGNAYSVLMIDLDFFKSINDRFGHDAGDNVLRETAALLKRIVRANEAAFRFGGEEFLLVIDSDAPDEALRCAERVRRAIEELRISGNGRIMPAITASIGVATCPIDSDTPPDLLQRADEALYAAKAGGRNRVSRFRLHIAGAVSGGTPTPAN
jgi:diguanylate cyclase (GGDEF)-like protein/PAS domain S-box-containing protein